MEIFREISPLKAFLRDVRAQGRSIGLVPTMGALHEGHLALLKASANENSITICSIYVNPAQFNNPVDLEKYPRTLESDIEILKKVGCDALFYPDNIEMYPSEPSISFDFGPLDKVLEGAFRPGHFSGVALVVSKFFNIVLPDQVYFGQKDWQQFLVVKRLADELMFGLTLRCIPTAREADGLAQSSRNKRLSDAQRAQATLLYRALTEAAQALIAKVALEDVKKKVQEMFARQTGIRLEYFELVNSTNLNTLRGVEGADRPMLCIAGYIGDVRLIDNMFLDLPSN